MTANKRALGIVSKTPIDQQQKQIIDKPGEYGRHFADDISSCSFVNVKFCIFIDISLKFVPKGPIDSNPALVKTMAWRRICTSHYHYAYTRH